MSMCECGYGVECVCLCVCVSLCACVYVCDCVCACVRVCERTRFYLYGKVTKSISDTCHDNDTNMQALGSQEDHKVAGDALSREIAKQRESRAQGEVPQWDVLRANRPKNRAAEFEDLPSTSVGKSSKARGLVFGAVYEHLDSSGRPRIIASTRFFACVFFSPSC